MRCESPIEQIRGSNKQKHSRQIYVYSCVSATRATKKPPKNIQINTFAGTKRLFFPPPSSFFFLPENASKQCVSVLPCCLQSTTTLAKEKWRWIANAMDLCELDSDHSHSVLHRNSQCSGAHTHCYQKTTCDQYITPLPPSTCNQLMEPLTISQTLKKRDGWGKKKKEKRKESEGGKNGNLLLYHRRH